MKVKTIHTILALSLTLTSSLASASDVIKAMELKAKILENNLKVAKIIEAATDIAVEFSDDFKGLSKDSKASFLKACNDMANEATRKLGYKTDLETDTLSGQPVSIIHCSEDSSETPFEEGAPFEVKVRNIKTDPTIGNIRWTLFIENEVPRIHVQELPISPDFASYIEASIPGSKVVNTMRWLLSNLEVRGDDMNGLSNPALKLQKVKATIAVTEKDGSTSLFELFTSYLDPSVDVTTLKKISTTSEQIKKM